MSSPCENCGGDIHFCKDCALYKGEYVNKSVIEDIKAEIKSQMDDDDYFCGLSLALQIIDQHISGKENNGQTKT